MDNQHFTTIDVETTRVQVQVAGKGCFVYQWHEGWKQNQQPTPDNVVEFNPCRPEEILREIEKGGFAVWYDSGLRVGFGLRGKITRVDLIQVGERVRVDKFPYGWTLSTPPISSDLKPEGFTLEQALTWFASKRAWTVRTWPGGARAWLGPMIPVRTKNEIIRRRDKLSERFYMGSLKPGEYDIDLAYDM